MFCEPYQFVKPNRPQFQLVVRRFAPFASFGAAFEGDDRSYSTSKRASYRAGAFLVFDLAP